MSLFEVSMVLLPRGIADSVLQHFIEFIVGAFLQSDEREEAVEIFDLLECTEQFFLEVFLLTVGQFAQVGFIVLQQFLASLETLANLSDEEFVETENLEACGLGLEDQFGTLFLQILLFGFVFWFVDQFRHALENP